MIYMDNAATTIQKPAEVGEAVVQAMQSLGNAGRGANEESLQAARLIYEVRERLARLFHAESPARIAFTANSTESLNIAVKGLLNPGDHAVTTVLEHNSVLRPLYEMRERGIELDIAGCDELGNLNYEELEGAVKENTRAIFCTHGSNLTGNLTDMKRIGEFAAERGILLVADASQTAGIIPIDVQAMGIDILCFTGHKSLLGPQGTGGIYVREGVEVRPLKSGGSGVDSFNERHPQEMPAALEAGTMNGHGIAGLGAALSYIEAFGLERIREIEMDRMHQFYEAAKEIPGVRIYGDFTEKLRCPIVALNLGDYDSAEVSDELMQVYGIATRPGAHCAPLMHRAFRTVEQGAVRFSFSHYTTKEEVEIAVNALREMAED